MVKALVHQITDALPHVAELEELLPQLVSSTDHLINAFIRAAALGHIDSYFLLVPEVFNVAEKHYRDIPQAIFFVKDTDHEWIAEDILGRVSNSEILTKDNREDIESRVQESVSQRYNHPLGPRIQ